MEELLVGPAKRKNTRRAHARKQAIRDLVQLLGSLAPPFGATAAESCSDLHIWQHAQGQQQPQQHLCCCWADIPSSCDPLHLLDNEANNFQRKGLSFEEHLALLNFGTSRPTATDASEVVPTPEEPSAQLHPYLHTPSSPAPNPIKFPGNGCTAAAASTPTEPSLQPPLHAPSSPAPKPMEPLGNGCTVATPDPSKYPTPGHEDDLFGQPLPTSAAKSGAAIRPLKIPRDPGRVSRGQQKRWQVDSFALVLRNLIAARGQQGLHIVDFGAGTGALLLPLAHMFPHCNFTGVEMKPAATRIMQHRVALAKLENVRCWTGMIEAYDHPFDVGLALHACGNATDYALQLAAHHRAAFLVSPCCVGKLKYSLQGGSSFSAIHKKWGMTGKPVGMMGGFDTQGDPAHTPEPSVYLQPSQQQPSLHIHDKQQQNIPPTQQQDQQQQDQQQQPQLQQQDLRAQRSCSQHSQVHASQPGARQHDFGIPGAPCPEAGTDAMNGVLGIIGAQQEISIAPPSKTGTGAVNAGKDDGHKPSPAGPFGITLQHPRSAALLSCLSSPAQFELLASVADTNHGQGQQPEQAGQPMMRKKQKLRLYQAQQQQQHLQQQQQEQHQHQQQHQQQQHQESTDANDSSLQPRQLDDAEKVREDRRRRRRMKKEGRRIAGADAMHPQQQHVVGPANQHEDPSQDGAQDVQKHSKDAEDEMTADTATALPAAEAAEEQHRCRLCKLTVELDRVVAAQEAGYAAGLFTMLHADEMAKSDLLVGIPKERAEWACMHSIFGEKDSGSSTQDN